MARGDVPGKTRQLHLLGQRQNHRRVPQTSMKTKRCSVRPAAESSGEFDLDDLKKVNPEEVYSLRLRNKSLLKTKEYLEEELRALQKQLDVALALKAHLHDRIPVIKPKSNRASQSIAVGIAS